MRILLILFISFLVINTSYAQVNDKISTIEFVQIVGDNTEEAVYYFEQNWEALRKVAIDSGYIYSYEFLESMTDDKDDFDFILKTTYTNATQYDNRELNFVKLIEQQGDLKLLNDKKPEEFRKSVYYRENVRHRN